MSKDLNSRKDKIRFLTNLEAGRTTIEDLTEQEHSIWMNQQEGSYEGNDNQQKVTYNEEEFQAYCKKHLKQNIIVLRPTAHCEPILNIDNE